MSLPKDNLSREFSDVGSDVKSEQIHRENILTLDQILEKPPAEIAHADDDIPAVLTWRSWLAVFLATVGTFTQVYVVVAAASVIGFIIRDLGEPEIAGWLIQGPLLMQSVLSPIVGRLSDLLDRKYLAGVPAVIALVGAIISAKATSMSMLIGGGVLIGAMLSTSSVIGAIPAEVVPMKWRPLSSGLNFAAGGLAGVVGGLSSGAMIRNNPSGWRNIFWFQVALHAITAIGFLVFYHPAPRDYPKMTLKELVWAVDPIGCFLLIIGATLLLLSLNWGGATYPWASAHVLSTMVIGIVGLLAFCIYEWKGRSDGIVAHVFFRRNRNFILSVIAFTTEGFMFFSAVSYYTPLIVLNLGFEDNSWDIGVRQLTYGVTSLVAVLPITWYSTKYKDIKSPLLFTFALFLAACIGYAFIAPTAAGNRQQYAWNVIAGAGQAGPLTLLVTAVQFSAPHAYLATATGLAFSGRAIGGSFGSAILAAIINGKLKSYPAKVGAAAVAAGLPTTSVAALLAALASGSATAMEAVEGNTAAITKVAVHASRMAYANAYKYSYIAIIPFCVLSMVCVACLTSVEKQMTEHVDSAMEDTKQGTHAAVAQA